MLKFFFLFWVFVSCAFSQDLYNPYKVIKMELKFYDKNYKQLLIQNKTSETDIPARLIVDDSIEIDSVGVRYKGNSSYNIQGDKKSFNVSIDSYRPDQRLNGIKTLNLNNGFVDPTFMREAITNYVFRHYLPAVRTGYAYLYINGEEYGLYSNVEQVNKDFLDIWFSSKSGNLYKGDPRGEFTWKGSEPSLYKSDYEKKTNEEVDDWTDLVNLINTINNSTNLGNELKKVLDTDRMLWYFALCNAFVNLDSYIFSSHNYYIYNDPGTGIFNMIPWDVNESFGVFPPNNLPFKKEEFPPIDLKAPNKTPLMKKMLANPDYIRIYYAHYRTILQEFINLDTLNSLINKLKPVIIDYVARDPKKLYSLDNFNTNINSDVFVQGRNVPGLVSFVTKRKEYLTKLAEFAKSVPVIEKVQCITDELNPGDAAWFNVTLSTTNTATTMLHYRIDGAQFEAEDMYDDGKHSDGAPGDNIYGVSVQLPDEVLSGRIEFYATAINNEDAMAFYPARAEFEYLTKEIEKPAGLADVVINEFMAANTATIQDPQGSYADWIELYNRSNSDISLRDWYMTDDTANALKWQFPDIRIEGNSYLIIWADEDEDEGLHADFKLSKSGEFLGLFNSKAELVDSISFGEQADNISTGRYPNGTGSFVSMNMPTPGAENKLKTGIVDGAEIQTLSVFPNPAGDYLEIKVNESQTCISIINFLGNTVLEQVLPATGQQKIDISFLPSGVYFIIARNQITPFVKY